MWRTKICAQPGCTDVAEQGKDFCLKHQEDNYRKQAARDRVRHETDKLYYRAPWLTFRVTIIRQNPICQRIVKGEQCRNPSRVVHHLISPRVDKSKFLNPKNVAALCESCHPGGTEGTPDWVPGVDFVPTKSSLPKFTP